jgi:hypothetical protein
MTSATWTVQGRNPGLCVNKSTSITAHITFYLVSLITIRWDIFISISIGSLPNNNSSFVRFQVLMAASMMFRAVFWVVQPCKLIVIPDDGGSTHLWHVGRQSSYTAVQPRRQLWTIPASPPIMKTMSFKQFIYFQKCTYVFMMRGISTTTWVSFFSENDGGVSAIHAYGNRVRRFRRSEKWFLHT